MKQVKAKLAKLLAEENITVRHSAAAKTASFDVKGRVLTLPIWKDDMSEDVYDLLTGHEVGHSLWTPSEDWENAIDDGVNKNVLNIVEDPRVDKKIKARYPGLVKAYVMGYRELMDKGFFGEIVFEEMNVLDRLNMHFKGGASLQVPFHPTEEWMLTLVAECETFDDVIAAAKRIQQAYTEDLDEQDQQMSMDSLSFGDDDELETGADFEELQNQEEDGSSGQEMLPVGISKDLDDTDPEEFDGHGDHQMEDHEVSTQSEYERREQDLQKNDAQDLFYLGLPKPILKNLIVSHRTCRTELESIIDKNYIQYKMDHENSEKSVYSAHLDRGVDLARSTLVTEYKNFRNQSLKIVNYMVKEFERKKAADEYKRTSVDKTGMLNVNKLHAYKYSDDLFLKRAIVHDGKNHGMVMLVDWSASMTYNMESTIKQLLSMIWFCNKVGIPYEVYAFTSSYFKPKKFDENGIEHRQLLQPGWKYEHNDAYFGWNDSATSGFRLLNLVSSRMSAKHLNQQLQQLFILGVHWSRGAYRSFDTLEGYGLGSTPMVEALVAMQEIVPNFREYYKLDKVNFICLTDGEANSGITRVWDEYRMGDLDERDSHARYIAILSLFDVLDEIEDKKKLS